MALIGRRVLAVAAVLLGIAAPAHADKASEINSALKAAFDSKDPDRDGTLDPSEVSNFVASLFKTVDVDGDGLITKGEFRRLSLNLEPIARRYGRTRQFAAAHERIRRRWTLGRRQTLSLVNLQLSAKGEMFAGVGERRPLNFAQFKKARFVRELVGSLR